MKNKHNIKYFPKKDKGYPCHLKFNESGNKMIKNSYIFIFLVGDKIAITLFQKKQRKKNTAEFETESSHFQHFIQLARDCITYWLARNIFFKRCLFLTGCELEKNPIQKKQQSVKNERNYRRI